MTKPLDTNNELRRKIYQEVTEYGSWIIAKARAGNLSDDAPNKHVERLLTLLSTAQAELLDRLEPKVRSIRDKYDITRTEANMIYGRPEDPIDFAKQHDQFEQSKMAITFEHEVRSAIQEERKQLKGDK